jgi:hypothetical protein
MRPSEAIKIMRLAQALATAAVRANTQTKRFKAMGLPVSSAVRNARTLAEKRLSDYLNSLYNVQNETKEKP